MPAMTHGPQVLFRSMANVATIFLLLLLFMFIAGLLGMQVSRGAACD